MATKKKTNYEKAQAKVPVKIRKTGLLKDVAKRNDKLKEIPE